MISLAGAKILAWGSPTAKIVTIAVVAVTSTWLWGIAHGQWKYYQGANETTTKIVVKSNKKAQRRDKRIGKKVNRIKPGSVRDRMRKAYSRPVER